MIKLRVKEIALKRGYKNAHQLQLALDVSPTLAANLWKGEMRQIGLGTIEKLCATLKVKPGSLFEVLDD
jgi:DNA-binding Xre family transcriptional regulator